MNNKNKLNETKNNIKKVAAVALLGTLISIGGADAMKQSDSMNLQAAQTELATTDQIAQKAEWSTFSGDYSPLQPGEHILTAEKNDAQIEADTYNEIHQELGDGK